MAPRQPSDAKLGIPAKQQKNERSAKALRDNLYRRKAQTRARAANATFTVNTLDKNIGKSKQGIVLQERGLKVDGEP